jgi:hypothetical protein
VQITGQHACMISTPVLATSLQYNAPAATGLVVGLAAARAVTPLAQPDTTSVAIVYGASSIVDISALGRLLAVADALRRRATRAGDTAGAATSPDAASVRASAQQLVDAFSAVQRKLVGAPGDSTAATAPTTQRVAPPAAISTPVADGVSDIAIGFAQERLGQANVDLATLRDALASDPAQAARLLSLAAEASHQLAIDLLANQNRLAAVLSAQNATGAVPAQQPTGLDAVAPQPLVVDTGPPLAAAPASDQGVETLTSLMNMSARDATIADTASTPATALDATATGTPLAAVASLSQRTPSVNAQTDTTPQTAPASTASTITAVTGGARATPSPPVLAMDPVARAVISDTAAAIAAVALGNGALLLPKDVLMPARIQSDRFVDRLAPALRVQALAAIGARP